jgi:hypothetical protein
VGFERAIGWLLSVALLSLAGCYESPPVVPEDYGPIEIEGWPSPRVYSREGTHPANRWFHRSFARRAEDGRIASVRADAPLSEMREPSPVDFAEITVLLGVLEAELGTLDVDSVTRMTLRADLLAQARFWVERGRDGLARRHQELAERVEGATDEWPRDLYPPILREARWQSVVTEDATTRRIVLYGISASAAARTGSVADSPAPKRAALLFAENGVPLECWTIDIDRGSMRPAVYRLDRAARLAGRTAWRQVPPDEPISIRELGARVGETIQGTTTKICASCHGADAPIITHGRKHVYGAIWNP